ncbi:MAG: transketolase C-terminal domain-containing protein [Bacteroidota bacterium]
MRDHFIEQLTALAAVDKRIILITGDLGFGVLTNFASTYPDQYINAGVAEQNMTGIASGLGIEGKIAFTYSIGNFCTLRCLEQIRNDACYHNANVTIVSVGGGFSYGALGYSHHATEDIAIMRALPNIRVFVPGDFWETTEITKAIVKLQGVNYLRLDKSSAGYTNKTDEIFEVGKARILREGADMTILATGGILEVALNAADELSEQGINCRVLSIHTIKPIDKEAIINASANTGGIITLEEHTVDGGLGGAVAEVLMESGVYPKKFKKIGLASQFSTIVGSQTYLREKYGLDQTTLVSTVKSLVK